MPGRDDNLPDPLLTTDQAALIAQVSAPTIRRAVARGELPAVRIGGRIRISREALEAHPVGRDEARA